MANTIYFSTHPFQTSTHAVGGGEWTIEVHDADGNFVREFCGSNGTREPADDLWAEYSEWLQTLPVDPFFTPYKGEVLSDADMKNIEKHHGKRR